jgi:hypothetical protein
MRLGIKLLNSSATLNQLQEIPLVRIARGEVTDLVFQLVDLDQKGLRYIPPAGSTVSVSLQRSPEISPSTNFLNERVTTDNSINRSAGVMFADDRSIYKVPFLAVDTQTMISTNIKVTVTEPSGLKIGQLNAAIKIIDGQES